MKVAVVVPCLNSARYLVEAVASAESAGAGIVVLADAGSSDPDTLGLLADLEALGYGVAHGTGTGAAVNTAVRRADAEGVLVLDPADRARPELLVAAEARLADGGIVCGDAEWFGDRRGRDIPGPPDLDQLRRGHGVPAAAVVARAAWDDAGGYDEALPALWQWDLLLRLLHGRWAATYVPEVLHERRARRPSAAETDDRRRAIASVVTAHPDWYRDFEGDDLVRLQSDLASADAWARALDLEAIVARDTDLNDVERDQLRGAAGLLRDLAVDAASARVDANRSRWWRRRRR
jgi:glycosyltransferase involved in cell wall biosynthesis